MGPMVVKGNGELKYFAIADDDKKFVWGNATIKGNTIEVFSALVVKHVVVRYAWVDNSEGCNLFNAAGLLAAPFRTASWPGKTLKN